MNANPETTGHDASRDSCEFASNHGSQLLLKEEVYQIVGAAFEVLAALGHGFHEKPYENALAVEFGLRGIPFVQQPRFGVFYKTIKVCEYVPDLVAYDSVVVDAKVIEGISDHERGQMLNYLRITGLQVGVILNFKHAKLEWERMILQKGQPRMNANARESRKHLS